MALVFCGGLEARRFERRSEGAMGVFSSVLTVMEQIAQGIMMAAYLYAIFFVYSLP